MPIPSHMRLSNPVKLVMRAYKTDGRMIFESDEFQMPRSTSAGELRRIANRLIQECLDREDEHIRREQERQEARTL